MRIVIVGPGSLGTIFGTALARGGHEATLLGRSSPRDGALHPRVTRLQSLSGSIDPISLPITSDPSIVAGADALIVLVKSFDTIAAMERIKPYVRQGLPILTLQNGLDNARLIRAALGDAPRVLPGVTSQAGMRPDGNLVVHTGQGPTLIGYENEQDVPLAAKLSRVFSAAGLPAASVPAVEREIWRKVAVNAAINGLTALGGFPNGAIIDEPDLLNAAETLAEEAAAVARAYGIELGGMRRAIVETATATARNRSSMLQDLEAGRPTEVQAIHGAIQEAAAEVGIATPAIDIIAALIRAKTRATRAKELTVA
jgi:2-dehydropantoate 2-reductase